MIFASDLDRTLIYSSKFIEGVRNLKVVEYKENVPLSYMTIEALTMLKKLNDKISFVPVTTRTMEQYKRINIFESEFSPKYAITSNGGNILINGIQDLGWKKFIQDSISKNGYTLNDVYKMTEPLRNETWVEKSRIADDVFFYLLTYKDDVDFKVLKEWSIKLHEIDWELIEHGRKIYCIPKCVNKRDALKHVSKKLEDEHIVSAGDSRMDLTMESISNAFIVPRHGELAVMNYVEESDSTLFTENIGIKAAESILREVESKYIRFE